MELEDFVSETLKQIISGTKKVSGGGDLFKLDSVSSKGVHFDLAVTTTETKKQSGSVKGSAGIIKVVSAGGEASKEKVVSSETISRIKFNITHQDKASSGGVVRPRPVRNSFPRQV